MLPILAITDHDDAVLIFDVLNNASVTEENEERRARLNLLLIAAHAEMIRTTATEESSHATR